MDWKNRRALVTGGASFIGSNLVNSLVARGAIVRVIDDLSSGRTENISELIESGKVDFVKGDLRKMDVAERAVDGMSVVFHLAADHGGRGYVDLHSSSLRRESDARWNGVPRMPRRQSR
jgi:nucleoside-diphosphate-sugar epimerase